MVGTVSNQGTISTDTDGNGTNDATRPTDDPAVGGGTDPTVFGIGGVAAAIPTAGTLALIAMALLMRLARGTPAPRQQKTA